MVSKAWASLLLGRRLLSALGTKALNKRLPSNSEAHALDTIDLSGLVGENPGSAINLTGTQASRHNPMGSAANPNLAANSTDMAQAYQDLSDKLSTELAGRMHQQLNEGQWKMKLGLKPSHLGAVDVELEMRDGKLSAVINADNASTQQLLNQGSPRLRGLECLGLGPSFSEHRTRTVFIGTIRARPRATPRPNRTPFIPRRVPSWRCG